MLRRAAAVALVAVLLLAGCGGKSSRPAVSGYIDQVNAVQLSLRKPLLEVARAYRDFGRPKAGKNIVPRLVRAEATIRMVDRRLAALRPPAEARRLHRLVLALVGAEAALAHEVVRLAEFSPRVAVAVAPLAPAHRQLRVAFASAKTAKAQADALDAYAAVTAGVLARLRALDAPPALAPSLASQRTTLARVYITATNLAHGLRLHQRKALPALIQRFANAGLAGESLAAQRARIAAIKAYNGRVAGLGALARRVDLERNRLERSLH